MDQAGLGEVAAAQVVIAAVVQVDTVVPVAQLVAAPGTAIHWSVETSRSSARMRLLVPASTLVICHCQTVAG
jgi:hypothetical protein